MRGLLTVMTPKHWEYERKTAAEIAKEIAEKEFVGLQAANVEKTMTTKRLDNPCKNEVVQDENQKKL